MGSATPNKNPNVYQIGGISVEFPYKPYGSQLAFMGRVISTLDRARRQGHCHALLESPTGTGKSLSLLCSALAWQQNHKSKNQVLDLSRAGPNPGLDRSSDPNVYGGGFIPESQPSSNLTSGDLEQSGSATNNKIQRKRTTPTIYYASRTHSQISQVIREYRKTSYRVPMAVLASRKHYCTNKHVCMKENVDEECKLLLKGTEVGCLEFKNAHKVKGHPSLQKGGCHEAHDIEDLVKVGQAVKGCSYFAARNMAVEAQLVFCPYSYIINPIIRRAMEVDLKGAIVILDEAHNIEDMARDAGSLDVEEVVLDTLQMELGQLCLVDSVAMIYQPLYDMIQGIISWIGQRKNNLQKREFEHYFSCWTGDKALRELQEAGISQQCFPILQECATKAIKAASDAEVEGVYLSGMSAATLEGIFSSFTYFFSGNGLHVLDYQLALQRYVKRDAGHAAIGWTHSLSLWCLNPAVVFREIDDLSLSVILTSGTLSPMSSFASELGVQFESCMEAPHVIDVESQLWAAVISTGPGNCQLNASYKTADGYAFQDALGASLEEICKIVPGGALVFFPSYKLLEKLRIRWVQTGQWSRLNAQKSLFVETRGNQDDFEAVLKGYYDAIRGNNRPAPWKVKKSHKRDSKKFNAKEAPPSSGTRGAAFLAVCRGKVSEGINFSDENARVVVIVGIPFPNKNDIQVMLKKKYNDTYKSSKNLLSGNQWYCHQAFRALNQAAGRCIRHRFDYGAIILLDERFKEAQNMSYISKWLRKSITQYDSFDMSLQGLRSFFLDVKERVSPNGISSHNKEVEILDIDEEETPSKRNILGKGAPRKKKTKMNMLDQSSEGKVVSDNLIPTVQTGRLTQFLASIRKADASLSQLETPGNIEKAASVCTDEKDLTSCREYIDLECNFEKDSRWSEAASMSSSNSSPDPCIVAETPVAGSILASPWISSKDECSHSTVVEASNKSTDQIPFHSISITNSSGVLTDGAYALAVTPERTLAAEISNPEAESSLNLSVNSHSQKRRKSLGVPLSIHARMSQFGSPSSESSLHFDHSRSNNISRNINQRIELAFEKPKVPTKSTCAALPRSSEFAKKRLHICCLHCGGSLGLPENCFRVTCSLASSSKVYLLSLMKSGCLSTHSPDSLSKNEPTSVPVVISDKSDVDQRLYNRDMIKGSPQSGIWCKEDGCVFRTVCCPFCTSPGTCLGLQIMATDASNVHLLNKICFYADRLNFKNHETSEEEVLLPTCSTDLCQVSGLTSIEKFSYLPQQKNFTCSSTTKSKLRLPKKDLVPSLDDQGGHT